MSLEIKPYAKNAKKHTKRQVEAIAKSIKEFGFNQPIVVDKKGVIIVGHGRWEAAKLLGIKNPPVTVADLSPKQARAYRLADNRLNESDWDMSAVLAELKDLDPTMRDITGFDLSKITDEVTATLGGNREVNVGALSGSLECECPKCGFQFPMPERKATTTVKVKKQRANQRPTTTDETEDEAEAE